MKLAIVLPCYNEQEVLPRSIEKLTDLFNDLIKRGKISADSFMMFVNDGSKDRTWEIISEQFEANTYVKGINLAGNVGHQNAIMAGMMTAKDMSDAVITMDADLQDDLNAIEKMVDHFANGYDIVYGVKVSRKADPLLKRLSATIFYKLQHAMGLKTIYNHADFRLMSRRALQQLSLYKERNLYLRGIVPMVGYRWTTVDDMISEREAGQSKYTLKKMLNLAVDGITSFSIEPIHWILGAGIFFLCTSVIMTIYILYSFFDHIVVPGWTSIMISLWFIGSILLLAIGVIGQYIGKIYTEVKERPLYNIEEILDEKEATKKDENNSKN